MKPKYGNDCLEEQAGKNKKQAERAKKEVPALVAKMEY